MVDRDFHVSGKTISPKDAIGGCRVLKWAEGGGVFRDSRAHLGVCKTDLKRKHIG
jgi:hypothetical protein